MLLQLFHRNVNVYIYRYTSGFGSFFSRSIDYLHASIWRTSIERTNEIQNSLSAKHKNNSYHSSINSMMSNSLLSFSLSHFPKSFSFLINTIFPSRSRKLRKYWGESIEPSRIFKCAKKCLHIWNRILHKRVLWFVRSFHVVYCSTLFVSANESHSWVMFGRCVFNNV